jgi:hypothetical protein
MADPPFVGPEKRRFPAVTLYALGLGLVVLVVAGAVDGDFVVPLLVLYAILLAAAVGYRLLAGTNRDEGDSAETTPRQPARPDAPLGASPEAHAGLGPHDLPLDTPVRDEVERRAEGMEGRTTGNEEGGRPERER